jgi:acetoin utilization protein AcuB
MLAMPTLAELCTDPPAAIRPDARLDAALELLVARETTELYVVDDDGRLLGVVPDYELLKVRLSGDWAELAVGQLASPALLCFAAQTPFGEALRAFREGRHSRAAVVDGGRLIGQVTRTSLLRYIRDEHRPTPPRPKLLRSELARNAAVLRNAFLG